VGGAVRSDSSNVSTLLSSEGVGAGESEGKGVGSAETVGKAVPGKADGGAVDGVIVGGSRVGEGVFTIGATFLVAGVSSVGNMVGADVTLFETFSSPSFHAGRTSFR
jgi:hypothetical protein